jgi:hypothetical protein
MRKPRDRAGENEKYYKSIKARGMVITSFLLPPSLREEVRQYIKMRMEAMRLNGRA